MKEETKDNNFIPESCKFGSINLIDQIYELKCYNELKFKQLDITCFTNITDLDEYNIKLKSPKIIKYEKDYLELIKFLKEDIDISKFEYTKEIGKLLSICAKYNLKVVLSKKIISDEEGYIAGLFTEDKKYIFLAIPKNASAENFLKTLRHEVFHLIQFVYRFGVLGIDIFDESAQHVLNSETYESCSINDLICEFEAHTADKVPFMTCEIESYLSEFSTIQ